jgi:DNA polymerase-3 subunit delta'
MSIAWPLYGHDAAQQHFLDAFASGRLHHAWLIEGAEGIGKATLARRLGAYLLGARGPSGAPLDADEQDPIVQACLAEGHPDLRYIDRELNDRGKIRQDITVAQIRDLSHFFELKAAQGGWRVGIIDSLDELNPNGANAILKTLEEPPANCALFLINHGSQSVLPTVRSRCRILRLNPLSEDDTVKALSNQENAGAAKSLARGRPGLGLRLASPSGQAASNSIRAVLRAMPRASESVVTSAVQTAAVDTTAFEAFKEEVLGWLATAADETPKTSEAWLSVSRLLGEANLLNMERAQTASKVLAIVTQAAKNR